MKIQDIKTLYGKAIYTIEYELKLSELLDIFDKDYEFEDETELIETIQDYLFDSIIQEIYYIAKYDSFDEPEYKIEVEYK